MTKPICIHCDEPYNPKRAALGYDYCLDCAYLVVGKPKVFIADVNKSNPTITLRSADVCVLEGLSGTSDQSKPSRYPMIKLDSNGNDSKKK